MRVIVITVGINQWISYTRPLIGSLRRFEPSIEVVVVDNGSKIPYREGDYKLVRSKKILCYAAAINLGIEASPVSDWYVIINNDVLCEGPFIKHLRKMDTKALYGNELNHASEFGHYVEGWLFAIPRYVLDTVGDFDELFEYAAFEDVDYSYRAKGCGFSVLKSDLPFKHLKAETRFQRPEYREVYLKNRRYLKEKHRVGV
jgi:GT2 family glycosyltransferase